MNQVELIRSVRRLDGVKFEKNTFFIGLTRVHPTESILQVKFKAFLVQNHCATQILDVR